MGSTKLQIKLVSVSPSFLPVDLLLVSLVNLWGVTGDHSLLLCVVSIGVGWGSYC